MAVQTPQRTKTGIGERNTSLSWKTISAAGKKILKNTNGTASENFDTFIWVTPYWDSLWDTNKAAQFL